MGKEERCAVELRRREDRGTTAAGGLVGTHHFCFATYQRPDRLAWGALRMLTDFRLAAGAVRQPVFNAEFLILTLVERGRVRRLGTYAPHLPLLPGSAELVSAGPGLQLGVEALGDEPAAWCEIWIRRPTRRRDPRRQYIPHALSGLNRPLATHRPRTRGALRWGVDAEVCRVELHAGGEGAHAIGAGHCAYIAVRRGTLEVNGLQAGPGDGIAATGPGLLSLKAKSACQFILIRADESDA